VLTRTIKVSCLSRFLLCSCTQDKFIMVVTPGHAHMHAIEILHRDKFLPPRQFVPRHCASALHQLCNRGQIHGSDKNCTAIAPALNKIYTMTAKTRAIPSLHRDNFLAKVPGHCPVLSSGNTTSLYCRAVRCNAGFAV
jgi:hypothetical protein